MLRGKLLRLRPAQIGDMADRLAWFNDPDITRPYFGRAAFTPARQVEESIHAAMQPDAYSGYLELAVETLGDEPRYIGIVFLRKISMKESSAEFGIIIGAKELWGKGMGQEATKLMVDYGFSELGLHRIWLSAFSFNEVALRLFKTCGFKEEGRLRETTFTEGRHHDSIIMSILSREWEGVSSG